MIEALVTGSKGFIGRALVGRLRESGCSVLAAGRDEGDVALSATWDALPPARYVFHLAARSYVPDSWQDPAGFMHTNVTGTQRALDYCRRHGARLVFASAYLYGIPARLPIAESDAVHPNNPYALSKHLAEQLCAFHAAQFGTPVTVIRPFNVYGPGQREEFLIPHIIRQVRAGQEIRLQDLAPKRDYVYVADVAEAFVQSMQLAAGHHVVNIGSGASYSVLELVRMIQQAAGTDLPVVSAASPRQQEIPDVRADISRAAELLGWTPRHALAEGIAKLLREHSP